MSSKKVTTLSPAIPPSEVKIPDPIDFDIVAEQAIIDERLANISSMNNSYVGHAEVAVEIQALIQKDLQEIYRLRDQIRQIQQQCYSIELRVQQTRKVERSVAENQEKFLETIQDDERVIAKSQFYIGLERSLPLFRLPEELKVKILRKALRYEGFIEIKCFADFAEFVLHPMCQKSSGVDKLALQVIFEENKFLIHNCKVVYKIFTMKLPRQVKDWLKNITIAWHSQASRLCKVIFSCTNLKHLSLRIDFGVLLKGNPYMKAAGTRMLLEKLPASCKVTILAAVVDYQIGSRIDVDHQERYRAELQSMFDNRPNSLPLVKPSPKKRKQASTSAASSSAAKVTGMVE